MGFSVRNQLGSETLKRPKVLSRFKVEGFDYPEVARTDKLSCH